MVGSSKMLAPKSLRPRSRARVTGMHVLFVLVLRICGSVREMENKCARGARPTSHALEGAGAERMAMAACRDRWVCDLGARRGGLGEGCEIRAARAVCGVCELGRSTRRLGRASSNDIAETYLLCPRRCTRLTARPAPAPRAHGWARRRRRPRAARDQRQDRHAWRRPRLHHCAHRGGRVRRAQLPATAHRLARQSRHDRALCQPLGTCVPLL